MARITGFCNWEVGYRESATHVAKMLASMPGRHPATLGASGVSFGCVGSGGGVAESGGRWLALDGRLLNADELKVLVPDALAGDATLMLALCRAIGFEAAMQRADGDIAVAYWDDSEQRLWLGRDRFGVKPMYYARSRDGFGFASTPGPLLSLPGVTRAVDPRYAALIAGSHYRTFDNAPERSPFVDVAQLPAAHCVEIGIKGPRTPRAYWQLKPRAPEFTDEGRLAERYKELLLAAVDRRVRVADRPAFTLSGGMDSSSVVSCAARIGGKPVAAFSSVYVDPTYDERNEIRDVIDAKLATWHPVEISDDLDIFSIVERLVGVHNEPVATATWLSHDIVCGAASASGHASLFGGLGGDELNAGEYEYFPLFFADLRAAGEEQRLAAEIECWARHHDHPIHRKNPEMARKMMAELTIQGSRGHCRPNFERQHRYQAAVRGDFYDLARFEPVMEHPFPSFLSNRAYQDLTRETTPCCLRAEDRQCAAYGLEHFDPFLDRSVVEFMFSVPGNLKIRDGITKRLLRQAMQDLLPEATGTRIKKTGWNAPAHRWFSGHGMESLRDLVASRSFRERGIYELNEVERLINEHEALMGMGETSMENHMMFLWQLVNLELWLRWVDRGAPGSP
jgi:asparagine synthase (glutamine-hydrolysing)